MVAEMQKQQLATGKTFFLDPRVKCAGPGVRTEAFKPRHWIKSVPWKGNVGLMLEVINREKKKTDQEETAYRRRLNRKWSATKD